MNNNPDWNNATWQGSRISQIKNSLKLTPQQRFEALDDFYDTSNWLAQATKINHKEPPEAKIILKID